MAHERKSQLLGMNFVTARNRLDRDLLFKFALLLGHKCYRCGGELVREDFSVDHKENWSEAADPVRAFFDLDNIAFSHIHCNTKEMHTRRTQDKHNANTYRNKGCRCDECKKAVMANFVYDSKARGARYLKYGT